MIDRDHVLKLIDKLQDFFINEVAQETNGGDSPATLDSCLNTILQCPDDLLWDDFGLKSKEAEKDINDLIAYFDERDYEVVNFIH